MTGWWNEPITMLMPGDPDGVEKLSSDLKGTGESIRLQAGRLRAANADIWKGDAATEFEDHVKQVPNDLDQLSTRYGGVAEALTGYARDLRGSQAKLARAAQRASEAHGDQVAAAAAVRDAEATNESAVRSAQSQNQLTPADPPLNPVLTDLGPLQRAAGDADEAMREAESLRIAAECDYDVAARRCKRTIDDRIDDGLKDSWWGWAKRTIKTVAPYLSIAAAIVGIAALCIPGLNLIALVLAGICLAVDTANAVLGQGEWTDVALDLVGVGAFKGVLAGSRAVRAARSADAGRDATRAIRTANAFKRAKGPAVTEQTFRKLRMSPDEVHAAWNAGNLKHVIKARHADEVARTKSVFRDARLEAAKANKPFRTMLRDTRDLVTNPRKQLSYSSIKKEYKEQVMLFRSGAPGARYGRSVVADSTVSVVDMGNAADELQDRSRAGDVNGRMTRVPVVAKGPRPAPA